MANCAKSASVTYTLRLNQDEADFIKNITQNSFGESEEVSQTRELRKSIFEALHNPAPGDI